MGLLRVPGTPRFRRVSLLQRRLQTRDGFHEFDHRGLEHYVKQTWFFGRQASSLFRQTGILPAASGATGWKPVGQDRQRCLFFRSAVTF